jgi:hypothetical protein
VQDECDMACDRVVLLFWELLLAEEKRSEE